MKFDDKTKKTIEWLQENTIRNKKKKITKRAAVSIAIEVYANFLRNQYNEDKLDKE